MEEIVYNLKVVMTEPLLGAQPQKDVATEYLQDKARKKGINIDDENMTLDEIVEKGTTVFHKLDGEPVYYDYHVRGFLKESAQVHRELDNVKQLRSKFDNLVFVRPRRIKLIMPPGGKMEFLERPLRAMTAQGPRVALARSEMLPAGTMFECQILVLKPIITERILRDILDFGKYMGFGQWRTGGYGRFVYELQRSS